MLFTGTNLKSQELLSPLFGDKLNSDVLEIGCYWSNIDNLNTVKGLSSLGLGFYKVKEE